MKNVDIVKNDYITLRKDENRYQYVSRMEEKFRCRKERAADVFKHKKYPVHHIDLDSD